MSSVFRHFYCDQPISGHDIIGISNGSADVANCITIVSNRSADSGVRANGAANKASSSDHQLARRVAV